MRALCVKNKMIRFKELKRIEAAIDHKNKSELEWSLAYCRNRLSIASLKQHQKHWKKLISELENTLSEMNET